MRGMVKVTLVWGGDESLEDPASNVVASQQVSFTRSEFPIRRNMRGYLLPSRWSYMLHEYGACSGTFRLPAVGSTAVVEAPTDWGTVEALPAPSGRCESSAASPHGQQVVRVAMANARTKATLTWTWNDAAAQSVAPTGARTASTVDLFIVE